MRGQGGSHPPLSLTLLRNKVEEGRKTPARGHPSASTPLLPLHSCRPVSVETGVDGRWRGPLAGVFLTSCPVVTKGRNQEEDMSNTQHVPFTVAIAQVAPVFMDRVATLEKA